MQFTRHQDFSDIPAASWNTLAAAGISDTPFARHEYISQWWKTLGGGEWNQAELVLISGSEDGVPVGIAPLFRAEHDGRMALLLAGSIEISDYLDLIVRAEDLGRFLSGLLDFLIRSTDTQGLRLDWYNLPDASPTLRALEAETARRGWTYHTEIYRPTPRVALSGGFEAFLQRLEKKQRHEIRRKMRRASESPVPVEFRVVDKASSLGAGIASFFELMAQDPSKARFLKPSMIEHLQSVMKLAFDNGYLWLAFLMVNGAHAAGALNFDYGNKLWAYNSGVNRDFLELSPGWVLLAHQIQWASENGRFEFDFMRGDEEYKYRFGGVNQYVMRATMDFA
jgi:CelD/BcsL family acetyltransferase involved in cellulose biosynthesis